VRSEPAPLRLLAGLALGALAARLVLMAGADPFMDEAYY
jgi:hypothetical protein